MRQRKFNCGLGKLLNMRTSAFLGCNFFNTDDLNGVSSCTMTRTHIPVALCDSSTDGQITVLSVHVMGTTSGIISKPNTKVLDLSRIFLEYPLDVNNFASRFLELLQ